VPQEPKKAIDPKDYSKKSIKIDVNRYMIKYDFDVAAKVCPIKSGMTYNDDFQHFYTQNAFMEVL